MRRLRLGVDLDGCVSNFVDGFRNWLIGAGHPGRNGLPDPDRWEMWEPWGFEKQEWFELFEQATAEGLFHRLQPYPGAIESLQQLKAAGHTIHIVTHRDMPHAQTSTVGWLAEKEIPYDTLTFARDKTCFPVDLFIEDNLDNARALQECGTECLVMRREWNTDHSDEVAYVEDWAEFVAEIEAIAETPDPRQQGHRGEVRKTSPTGGEKGSKPEAYSMLPVEPLAEVARVYNYGATKYARDNWAAGYDWSLSYDALQRHANRFWSGETFDPETGLHHLGHAVFHCFTLIAFGGDLERYDRYDNRPRPNPFGTNMRCLPCYVTWRQAAQGDNCWCCGEPGKRYL